MFDENAEDITVGHSLAVLGELGTMMFDLARSSLNWL
jgi:hypothetical protein